MVPVEMTKQGHKKENKNSVLNLTDKYNGGGGGRFLN